MKPFLVDVVFVFAASKSNSVFQTQQKIAIKITDTLFIDQKYAKVGAVIYGEQSKVVFNLNKNENNEVAKESIKAIQNPTFGSSLISALQLATGVLFLSTNGARFGGEKMLIIFMSSNMKESLESVLDKFSDTQVFIIRVDKNTFDAELKFSPSSTIKVLDVTDDIDENLVNLIRPGDIFCINHFKI